MRIVVFSICLAAVFGVTVGAAPAPEPAPPWANAKNEPMNPDEARAFMKRLAQFVHDNHLKHDANSPQRGIVYEYLDVKRKGEFDQFVQGEALDTMHDGAWLAAALVNAHRVSGDPFYKEFLTTWQLPFYCKMLNHSDELFSAKRNDARPGTKPFDREHALQEGEKGFVPYFWDDGGSVSLEMRLDKIPKPVFPATDFLAGKDNPRFLLDGYSHGSSNHLAQDLGVMLQQAWLLLKDSQQESDKKLAAEVAEAAKNLHECRVRHHGPIPMCVSPAALALNEPRLMNHVPDPADARLWEPDNHYWRALYAFTPGQRYGFPGFADDQQYRYYHGIARAGGTVPDPLAFRTVYDAFTEPMLYRHYCDDEPPAPGVNVFDLHPYHAQVGKPVDYRSDRKGPHGNPKPAGSRFGPQNMVMCGVALQILKARPGVWEQRYEDRFAGDHRVYVIDNPSGVDAAETSADPSKALNLGGAKLVLTARRRQLIVAGSAPGESLTFTVYSRHDMQGPRAVVTIKQGGTVSAVNDRGDALIVVDGAVNAAGDGRMEFRLALPFTSAKGQKPWANGVEHGRYSIRCGTGTRNLYLASREQDVKAWLERELAGGLRTWEAVFNETGFIPTGVGTGTYWDHYSDSGGYAHLVSAAAQWAMYLEGKNDWEVHNVPRVPPR